LKTLSDVTFKQLRDFIYEKSGIYISDSKKYLLENRLPKRIQARNLGGYEDYLYLLLYGNASDELPSLFDTVTTNETFFFREIQQLETVTNHVATEVMKKQAGSLAIWSAACSTGEEPYSLSLMLMEKGYTLKREILASDISQEALASAARGIYNSYSVRNVPPAVLGRYFKPTGQNYELSPSVKNSVKFMSINLIDEKSMRAVTARDVIFCRNVLIYFDEKAKRKAVSLLYDSLKPGGYLVIGMSESLHNITRAFKPVIVNKTVLYQKV
jgi:chemotaxis protein methyltransferase CheR